MDSNCIYELYIYILNPYPFFVRYAYYYVVALLSFVLKFMLMHSLSTQGSAGMLHVPACKHDRPPFRGSILYACAVYRIIPLRLCISPHPKPFGVNSSRTLIVVNIDDLSM